MKFLFLLICIFTHFSCFAADLIRIDKGDGTFFKATTGQASTLPASQKCELNVNDIMEYNSISDVSNHFKITLPRAYPGCALESGYLYQPHVSTHATTLTVYVNTIFKKTTQQSSTLPSSDKCDLSKGFYKTSSNPSLSNGHYAVNFASVPPGCGFSSGYVTTVHSTSGINGMTLRSSAWLKKSTANSSTLPDSDKCLIGADNYVLSSELDARENHYQVELATSASGCGFNSGYVYYFNTTFSEPTAAPPTEDYTWPQPGSSLGSAWCVCRNIGSSPHIGQDFVQSGRKSAVAIQTGTITSSTFSSSCGHIVLLEDDSGGVWRYVHLNQPLFGVGSRIQNGQKIADISAYPRSGCGTGPHLHFERRSSGAFGDGAIGKSCQNGFRTCHFDPIKPFRNESRSEAQELAVPIVSVPQLQQNLCKILPQDYPDSEVGQLNNHKQATKEFLNWNLNTLNVDGENHLLEISVELVGNEKNICDLSSKQDCIVSWSVVAEQQGGELKRLFYDASVRNQTVERVFEESYCMPHSSTGKIYVLLQTARGESWLIKQNSELN